MIDLNSFNPSFLVNLTDAQNDRNEDRREDHNEDRREDHNEDRTEEIDLGFEGLHENEAGPDLELGLIS